MKTRAMVLPVMAIFATIAFAQTSDRRLERNSSIASQQRRLALVIGNDSYSGALLQNGRNDARAVAGVLRELGFTVTLLEDATQASMGRAIANLAETVTSRDVALFYFAGHGLQIGGENYLVPVDYRGSSTAAARFGTIPASQIQETIAKASVSLLVLDACRNNPYSGERGTSGLAPMEARGSLVAFATSAGQTASDSPGSANGLFTRELLSVLREPGLNVRDVFYRVRQRVYNSSNGLQFPAVYDGLLGDLVLRAGVSPVSAPAPPVNAGLDPAEIALWNAVEKSSRAADLDVYLLKYPSGVFAELARSRRASLKPETETVPPPNKPAATTGAGTQDTASWLAQAGQYTRSTALGREIADVSLAGCTLTIKSDFDGNADDVTRSIDLQHLDLAQTKPISVQSVWSVLELTGLPGRQWNVRFGDGRTLMVATARMTLRDGSTADEALRRLREMASRCRASR